VILSLDLIPSVHLEPNGPAVAFFPQSQTRRRSTSRGGSHADEPPPSGVGARFLHRPDLCDTAEIANRWEEFSPWMAPCSALPTGRCGSRRNPQHRRANTGPHSCWGNESVWGGEEGFRGQGTAGAMARPTGEFISAVQRPEASLGMAPVMDPP
jgi:hypothetical protein